MIWVLTFFGLGYTVFICLSWWGWFRLPSAKLPPSYEASTRITLIIAIRNEAENILNLLRDLERQTYPISLLEVMVVDDFSEDNSVELVKQFAFNAALNIRVCELKNGTGSGKKSAVNFGVQQATGQLVVQTDGDCRVQPDWLKLLVYTYVAEGAKFISGPVCLEAGDSVFEKMQVVEFASLIGSGAAAIGLGKPNMCNGANLAFEKAAFEKVSGYAGNEQVASGDDEFLMHKIHARFPGKVSFLKASDAIVFTAAKQTVSGFISQRVRWASKWRFYQNLPAQLVAVLVFGVNLLVLVAAAGWLSGQVSGAIFWSFYLLKTGTDIVFLLHILRFLRKPNYLIFTLPLQLVYAPYVVYCALAGLTGKYNWKGRILKNRD